MTMINRSKRQRDPHSSQQISQIADREQRESYNMGKDKQGEEKQHVLVPAANIIVHNNTSETRRLPSQHQHTR